MKQQDLYEAKLFQDLFFATEDGGEFVCFPKQRCESGHPITIFSVIDFDETLTRCCAPLMLQKLIASRIGHGDSKNREDLISIA